jgi:UDP:flavonoid glycosyltransferase YjiC (YdhE family)
VRDALRDAGVRAVLVAGWGGLAALADDDVFCVESVPYDWLFPRVAATVHHGGAGTTGAALQAGVPAIVVPFTVDQPFWGARVAALGAGPTPIPRARLTRARLAEALRRTVADEAMHARAAELGALIRAEDGVAEAVGHFERLAPPPSRRVSSAP